MEILIDRLTLGKTGESAMLPKDGSGIGKSTGEALVTALERSVAKLHTLVKYLPELLHAALCAKADVGKVNGYDALIEAAVILRLTVLVNVGSEEGSTAHTGVALTVAVLVNLVFEHNFFRNVPMHEREK